MLRTHIVPGAPALMAEGDRRILAVSDIHLGFDAGLGAAGAPAAGGAAREAAAEIAGLAESHGADAVFLLGDVKSSVRGISRGEWDHVPPFFEEVCKGREVALVPGNHDSGIERLVPGSVSMAGPSGIVEGGTLFTHGHAMPSENFGHVGRIVMGHVHPTYFEEGSVLNGQRVWVSIMAERGDIFPSRTGSIEIIVMPAFSRYLYATRKSKSGPVSPILKRVGRCRARITTLDGSIIGDESALGMVL